MEVQEHENYDMDANAVSPMGIGSSKKERVVQVIDEGSIRQVDPNPGLPPVPVSAVTTVGSPGTGAAGAQLQLPQQPQESQSDLSTIMALLLDMRGRQEDFMQRQQHMEESQQYLVERQQRFEQRIDAIERIPDQKGRLMFTSGPTSDDSEASPSIPSEIAAMQLGSSNAPSGQDGVSAIESSASVAVKDHEDSAPVAQDSNLSSIAQNDPSTFQIPKRKGRSSKRKPVAQESVSSLNPNAFDVFQDYDHDSDDSSSDSSDSDDSSSESSNEDDRVSNDQESMGDGSTSDSNSEESDDSHTIREVDVDSDEETANRERAKTMLDKILNSCDVGKLAQFTLDRGCDVDWFLRKATKIIKKIKGKGGKSTGDRILQKVKSLLIAFANSSQSESSTRVQRQIQLNLAAHLCALGSCRDYRTATVPKELTRTAQVLSINKINDIVATAKKAEGPTESLKSILTNLTMMCMNSTNEDYFALHFNGYLSLHNIPLRAELMPPGSSGLSENFHDSIMQLLRDIKLDDEIASKDPYLSLLKALVEKGTNQASACFVNGKTTGSAAASSGGKVSQTEAGIGVSKLYKKYLNFLRAFGLMTNNQAAALETWAGNMRTAAMPFYTALDKAGLFKGFDAQRRERLKSDLKDVLMPGGSPTPEMEEMMMLTDLEKVISFPYPLRYTLCFLEKGRPDARDAQDNDLQKYEKMKKFADFTMSRGQAPQAFMDQLETLKRSITRIFAHQPAAGEAFIKSTMESEMWRFQILRSVRDNYGVYAHHGGEAGSLVLAALKPFCDEWHRLRQDEPGKHGTLAVLSVERMEELFATLRELTVKGIEDKVQSKKFRTAALSSAPSSGEKKKHKSKQSDKSKSIDREPSSEKFCRFKGPNQDSSGLLFLKPGWKSDWSNSLVDEGARKLSVSDLKQLGHHLYQRFENSKRRGFRYVYDATLLEKVLSGEISPQLPDGLRVAIPPPHGLNSSEWDRKYGRMRSTPAEAPSVHAIQAELVERVGKYILDQIQTSTKPADDKTPAAVTDSSSEAAVMQATTQAIQNMTIRGDRTGGFDTVFNVSDTGEVFPEESSEAEREIHRVPRSSI